nr:hypothetical protein [Angustibacter aerolatus]
MSRAIASAVASRSGSMSCSRTATSRRAGKPSRSVSRLVGELDAAGADEADRRHARIMPPDGQSRKNAQSRMRVRAPSAGVNRIG